MPAAPDDTPARAYKGLALLTANVEEATSIRNQYAVSADGQRFLILSAVNPGASPIVAVLNWHSLSRE